MLGRPAEILDAHQGTEVFQMSPRLLAFTRGRDHVACMQLTKGGALRWYARCCRTPIAHTLASPRIPFVAINHLCIDWAAAPIPRSELIGPVRARINGDFKGRSPESRALEAGVPDGQASRWALVSMLAHYVPLFCWWLLRGDARHSPLWDDESKPIAPPERIHSPMLPQTTNAPLALRSKARPARGCG